MASKREAIKPENLKSPPKRARREIVAPKPPRKPKVFFGSSLEALSIVNRLVVLLDHVAEVFPWQTTGFDISSTPIEALMAMVDDFDFAVFVFHADDKVYSRGKKYFGTRDNTLIEFGLFLGVLGRDRCFIVKDRANKTVKTPSDLAGVIPVEYDGGKENAKAALNAASIAITEAMNSKGLRAPSIPSPASNTTARDVVEQQVAEVGATSARLVPICKDVSNLLSRLARRKAGMVIDKKDGAETDFLQWTTDVLTALRKFFQQRSADVNVVWSRPVTEEGEEVRLKLFLHAGDVITEHYQFGPGEGFAGTLWQRNEAGLHTAARPHPYWMLRTDCTNVTYMSAPVGGFSGQGGLLSIGSDTGFALGDEDLEVVKLFASLLALSIKPF